MRIPQNHSRSRGIPFDVRCIFSSMRIRLYSPLQLSAAQTPRKFPSNPATDRNSLFKVAVPWYGLHVRASLSCKPESLSRAALHLLRCDSAPSPGPRTALLRSQTKRRKRETKKLTTAPGDGAPDSEPVLNNRHTKLMPVRTHMWLPRAPREPSYSPNLVTPNLVYLLCACVPSSP